MSRDTIRNMAASVHDRLQSRAREMGKPFIEVLQYYGIERFLFRLSKTKYGRKFVLKGGLIFYSWGLPLRRPTKDIDLRGYTNNSTENLVEIIRDVCLYSISEDALVFHVDSIEVNEIIPDAEYRGVRVTLLATLGRSEIPIQIDIGFTDEIIPCAQEIIYPTLLIGMESPHLMGYSRESIVSEKFHAMVYLNEVNSRLKDFYDIWMLSEQFDFEGMILRQAIETTFRRRETAIPIDIPVALSDHFALGHQKLWQRFLTKQKISSTKIENFNFVIERLRVFLLPPVQTMATDKPYRLCWKAGLDWE